MVRKVVELTVVGKAVVVVDEVVPLLVFVEDGTCPWVVAVEDEDWSCPWVVVVDDEYGSCPWVVVVDGEDGSCPWVVVVDDEDGSFPWVVVVELFEGESCPWVVKLSIQILNVAIFGLPKWVVVYFWAMFITEKHVLVFIWWTCFDCAIDSYNFFLRI